MDGKKKADYLESIERLLYSAKRAIPKKPRANLFRDQVMVNTSWGEEDKMKKAKQKSRFEPKFKAILFLSFIFFLGAVAYAVFSFVGDRTTVSDEKIGISVVGSSFVAGGEVLPIEIQVSNQNRVTLSYVDLRISYSKSGLPGGVDTERKFVGLDDLSPGSVKTGFFDVVLYGEQGSSRDITVTLDYRIGESNTIYTKEIIHPVSISTSPISIEVDGPSGVVPNQEFTLKAKVRSNSLEVTENVAVIAIYPSGFIFSSSTPNTSVDDNIWNLGDLAPGGEKEVVLKGILKTSDVKERVVSFTAGIPRGDNKRELGVQFGTATHAVSSESPFMFVSLFDGAEVVTAKLGARVQVRVDYENTSQEVIKEAKIKVALSGSALADSTIDPGDGVFDAGSNTILFTKSEISDLGEIAINDTGSIPFDIFLPASGVEEPEIVISVSVEGKTAQTKQDYSITNLAEAVIRIETAVSLSGGVYYFGGPIDNTGPLPPAVGEETTYSVKLSLQSTTNPVEDIEVKGVLPTGVEWTNKFSPASEQVTYNSLTREVSWFPGRIFPSGNTSSRREMYFQVALTPFSSQALTTPNLFENIRFVGTDGFSGKTLEANLGSLNISLLKDDNYNQSNDKVVN